MNDVGKLAWWAEAPATLLMSSSVVFDASTCDEEAFPEGRVLLIVEVGAVGCFSVEAAKSSR